MDKAPPGMSASDLKKGRQKIAYMRKQGLRVGGRPSKFAQQQKQRSSSANLSKEVGF